MVTVTYRDIMPKYKPVLKTYFTCKMMERAIALYLLHICVNTKL